MKNLSRISALLISVAALGFSSASAQSMGWRDVRPQKFFDLRALTNAAERESNRFRSIVEKRDDRIDHRLNDYTTEPRWLSNRDMFFDELKPDVQRLDESFEHLRRDVDTGHPMAGREDVRAITKYATMVDHQLSAYPNGYGEPAPFAYKVGPVMSNQWSNLRVAINNLARFYDLPTVGNLERNGE